MVAVTDATRPEVTAKLTVNGVEPKSTPLWRWWEELYYLRWWWCGCDLYSYWWQWQVEKKWKSLHERIWTTMLLNGNFFGSSQYGTGDIVLSRAILRLPVRTLQPSQRLFIWRMIFTIPTEIHGNATSRLLTMPPIWTVQMVWVRFGLLRRFLLIVRQVWRRQALFRVTSLTALTDADKSKVIAAVSAVNPEVANRIKSYTVNSDGTVTITYKDSTTNVVAVKLSDSDHSQSVSNSQSASAKTSQSISQSLSAKQSQSVSTQQSVSLSQSLELGSLTKFVSFTKPISIGKRIRSKQIYLAVNRWARRFLNLNPLQRVNLYRQENLNLWRFRSQLLQVSVPCSLLRYQQVIQSG